MKRRTKLERSNRRRQGLPPRWLVLGALAASAALWSRVPAGAQEGEGDAAPGGEADAVGQPGSLAPGGLAALAAGPRRPASATRRFDIPAGSLGTALETFERMTGVRVRVAPAGVGELGSPGVSGVFTAEQALARLLDGTGLAFRFTEPTAVTLEVESLVETLDVVAPATPAPSSPKYVVPLRDLPQTLTVIPQKLIAEQGASTLRDVLRNVTGISIQAGEGGGGLPGDNLAIRGFASRNDVFVDGVRDFGSYTRDPFNVEQVEVTKGPASLYAGRGSTGGSLNLASKVPSLEGVQSGTLGAGTDNFGRATLDVNLPLPDLGTEGAALRVNAMWTQGDTPGRDAVENGRWGIAPSLAFGLGTATRVKVSYFHLDQDNVPEYGIPWVPPTNTALPGYADKPAPVSFDSFYGLTDRDFEKTVTGIATAELANDFGDSLTWRSLARYGRSDRDSVITSPRFVDNTSTLINRQLQARDLVDGITIWQNDLNAEFSTGDLEHSLVAGAEVSRETAENRARTGPTAPTTDLFNPNPGDAYSGQLTYTGARTESTADTVALYASDTVEINEHWQVTAGLRYDHFDIDFESVALGGVMTPFGRTDDMLSWRGGVVYKPRANGSVYASYGTSFNPSSDGATGLSLAATTVDLEPEKSRGFEVGTKWDLLDARMQVTGALFRTEKTNARTPGLPGEPSIVLAGDQRVDGIELGLSGRLTDRWNAYLGYTLLSSEILESNTPAEVGKELPNTPENSFSLWTTYRLWRGVEVGGGVQFVDDRYNSATNTRRAPSYTLYDAMASYDLNDRLTLRLNVNNLTDERYIDRVGGGHFIPGAGRSATLSTAFRF